MITDISALCKVLYKSENFFQARWNITTTMAILFRSDVKMMTKFSELVNEILMANGWNPISNPSVLVESWEAFVKECEEGYSWTIYEYDDEIRVREKIELILTFPKLEAYKEIQDMSSKVKSLDSRIKSLFITNITRRNKKHWWDRGVLKYSGKEYARDINQELDIEIKVV